MFWGKRKMRGRGKGKKEEDTQSAHCPDSSPSSSSSSPATITVRDKVDYATVSSRPIKQPIKHLVHYATSHGTNLFWSDQLGRRLAHTPSIEYV